MAAMGQQHLEVVAVIDGHDEVQVAVRPLKDKAFIWHDSAPCHQTINMTTVAESVFISSDQPLGPVVSQQFRSAVTVGILDS